MIQSCCSGFLLAFAHVFPLWAVPVFCRGDKQQTFPSDKAGLCERRRKSVFPGSSLSLRFHPQKAWDVARVEEMFQGFTRFLWTKVSEILETHSFSASARGDTELEKLAGPANCWPGSCWLAPVAALELLVFFCHS